MKKVMNTIRRSVAAISIGALVAGLSLVGVTSSAQAVATPASTAGFLSFESNDANGAIVATPAKDAQVLGAWDLTTTSIADSPTTHGGKSLKFEKWGATGAKTANPWSGVTVFDGIRIGDSSHKTITFDYYSSDSVSSPVEVKIEKGAVNTYVVKTAAPGWNSLSFDMSTGAGYSSNTVYTRASIIPNWSDNGSFATKAISNTGQAYYIDNVSVNGGTISDVATSGPAPVTTPTPTVPATARYVSFESNDGIGKFASAFQGGSSTIQNAPASHPGKALKFIKESAGQAWSGFNALSALTDMRVTSADKKTITFDYYSPDSVSSPVMIKLEGSVVTSDGNSFTATPVVLAATATQGWNALSFDVSTSDKWNSLATYSSLAIFPNFGKDVTGLDSPVSNSGQAYYVDNISVNGGTIADVLATVPGGATCGASGLIRDEPFTSLSVTGNTQHSGLNYKTTNDTLTFTYDQSDLYCSRILVTFFDLKGVTLTLSHSDTLSSTACELQTDGGGDHPACLILLNTSGHASFTAAVGGASDGDSLSYSLAGDNWSSADAGGFSILKFVDTLPNPTTDTVPTKSSTMSHANIRLVTPSLTNANSVDETANIYQPNVGDTARYAYFDKGSTISLTYRVDNGAVGATGSALANKTVYLIVNKSDSCSKATYTWGAYTIAADSCGDSAAGAGKGQSVLSGTTDANGLVTFTLVNTNKTAEGRPTVFNAENPNAVYGSGNEVGGVFIPTLGGLATAESVDQVWPHIVELGAPDAPTGVSVKSLSATSLKIDWTAPLVTGGTISKYTYVLKNGSSTVATADVTSGTSATITTGLSSTGTYSATVTATSTGGTSPEASSAGTVKVAAAAAKAPTAAVVGTPVVSNAAATVSWTAAANNGASITGYSVAVLAGSTTVQTIKAAGNATSVSIGGLTNGTAYTVVVTATNIVGSTASKATKAFTPATTPGTPTGVTVARTLKSGAPTAGALTVTWTAPASGGSAITGYSVVCKNGDVVAKTVAVKVVTTAAVTGLTNGTSYVCSVAAINAKGTGTAAEGAAIRPGALPGSPASVTGVAGSLKVTLTIGAPTADGGSAVTKYLVTVIDKNKATVGSVIEVLPANIGSVEVSGLSAKSAYTFSVVAQTALGNSVAKVSAKVTTL